MTKTTRHVSKLLDIKTEGKNPQKASGRFGLATKELIWKETVTTCQPGAAPYELESGFKETVTSHHEQGLKILSPESYTEL